MIQIALIGAGRIGKVHAQSIQNSSRCRLSHVFDVYDAAAQEIAKSSGATFAPVDAILADPTVDVVMICSSTDTHADLVERAARAGKVIFCEKPIDLSMDRVDAVLNVVKKANAKLMLGFNRRFDPNFRALKAALDEGQIGTPEIVTIASRDPGAPPAEYLKVSGGLFRDMTIHDFDMARWLLGEEPVTVYATAAALTDKKIGELGDVDTAVVTLTCASGRTAVITNSRRATYGYDQRIEVHGSGGMLQAGNILENTVTRSDGSGQTGAKPMFFFLERYSAAYRGELDYLLDAIEQGRTPSPDGDDGRRALLLAEAAMESVKRGTAVPVAATAK